MTPLALKQFAIAIVCAGSLMASPAWASKKLIRAKGCMECHDAQNAKIGPSWRQIGKLYKRVDAEAALATKIRSGAAEHWGPNVMTPPAARGVEISEAQARSMAHYILRYR